MQSYLDILVDSRLTIRLPAFQPRLRVRERRHSKLCCVDLAFVRAVRSLHGPIVPEEGGTHLGGWILHKLSARGERGEL